MGVSGEAMGVREASAEYGLQAAEPGVPVGYKQTEVGVIPEDWDIRCFGEIVNYTKGFAFSSADYQDTGVRVLRVSDTAYDTIKDEKAVYISERFITSHTKWQLKEGDLVFSTVGSKPPMYDSLVGKVIIISEPYSGSLLNQNAVLIRAKEFSINFQMLLLNHFRTERYISFIESIYRGNANQASITLNNLFQYKIPLPPTKSEQRAIATALSDMDALLDGLDRLIAKKRDLKQATMQQLLTGQTRLPGFEGEWEVKALETITDCLDNLRVPLNEAQRGKMRGDYPYCGANGILGFVDDYVIDDDIILMAEDGGYFEEYETRPIAYRMTGKCWVNNHAHILRAKAGINQNFIYFSLVHKNILPFLASGTRAKLNKSEMNNIEIKLPSDFLEQTAISTILSDMDAEIEALEQRRGKTRDLKRAMMQELLTGRTRLI